MTFLTLLGPYFSSHSNSCPSEHGLHETPALTYAIQLLQGLSLSRLVRLCGTFLLHCRPLDQAGPSLTHFAENCLLLARTWSETEGKWPRTAQDGLWFRVS